MPAAGARVAAKRPLPGGGAGPPGAGRHPGALAEPNFQASLRSLSSKVADPSLSEALLRHEFAAILAMRQQLLTPAPERSAADEQAEKDNVMRLVCNLLAQTPEQVMPLQEVCGAPQIRSAVKGVVSKMEKFLLTYSGNFQVEEVPHADPSKLPVKFLRLLAMPGPAYGRPGVPSRKPAQQPVAGGGEQPGGGPQLSAHEVEQARTQVTYMVLEYLELHGEDTIQHLSDEPAIAEAKRGTVKKLSQLLGKYPATFEVFEMPGAEGTRPQPTVRLVPGGAEALAQILPRDLSAPQPPAKKRSKRAPKAKDPLAQNGFQSSAASGMGSAEGDAKREALLDVIRELVGSSPEGAVRLEDISQEPTVVELRKGGASGKLGPFLEKHPEVFIIYDAEAEAGRTVRCVSLVP